MLIFSPSPADTTPGPTRKSTPLVCQAGQTRCRDNSRCYPIASYCNGVQDCFDGSDEPDGCSKYPYYKLFENTASLTSNHAGKVLNTNVDSARLIFRKLGS